MTGFGPLTLYNFCLQMQLSHAIVACNCHKLLKHILKDYNFFRVRHCTVIETARDSCKQLKLCCGSLPIIKEYYFYLFKVAPYGFVQL